MPASFTAQEVYEVISSILIMPKGTWETQGELMQSCYQMIADDFNRLIVQHETHILTDRLIQFLHDDQDAYYEIRDYLRSILPQASISEVAAWLQVHFSREYEETLEIKMIYWEDVAADFMADTQELMDYEAAHGLPTEP